MLIIFKTIKCAFIASITQTETLLHIRACLNQLVCDSINHDSLRVENSV